MHCFYTYNSSFVSLNLAHLYTRCFVSLNLADLYTRCSRWALNFFFFGLTLSTLWRTLFYPSSIKLVHHFCPDDVLVIWVRKQSHQHISKGILGNPLEVSVLTNFLWNFVRISFLVIFLRNLKLNLTELKTRSPFQIIGKLCEH